ncbi:FadR/GntR family transcriptional regulator [Paenibacillus koleovorans]|uniref:FadR/GntR family transcriptional regulator n=1 Tax=Paenibacillus koleovorans TaxID=121608 RepID=UPI0013E33076|nr:FadR/GntR family transcriptional regulator [Paenibacillus koleovorans]
MKRLASTKVVTELTQRIEQEVWKGGEKLPSLNALALEFAVSVATLREALRILENQGYILIEHGRGIFVRSQNYWRKESPLELDPIPMGDLVSLLEFREILEPEMARLAAERGTPGQIKGIKEAAAQMVEDLAGGVDYFRSDIAFHDHIAQASSNEVMSKVMKGISDMLSESRSQTKRIQGSPEKAAHFHMLIALAIEQRNGKLAKEMMYLHLQDVREDVLRLKESDQSSDRGI